MSMELERLEDRLALSPAVTAAPDAPRGPAVTAVTPAENESLVDPLLTRLGPRQEMTPLFPAAPGGHYAPPAPADGPLAPEEALEDELMGDGPGDVDGLLPMIDVPPRPTEATSDQIMSEPAELGDEASPADPEGQPRG